MTYDSAMTLVVVGPTAAGKSAVSLALAERLAGRGTTAQVVSADAMQVYRAMDIGTAKPTDQERQRFRHHLIDVVEPMADFSVTEYQRAALQALAECARCGAAAIMVGGTGLYIRSVLDNLRFPGQFPDARAVLDAEPDTAALYRRLAELDPAGAARMEPTNRRRLVRALEVTLGSGRPFSSFGPGLDHYPPTPAFIQVGIDLDRSVLDERIAKRYADQLAAGFVDEVAKIDSVGWSQTAGQALGYRELRRHLAGERSLEEALAEAVTRTRRFARRQQRWFRRDPRITWLDGQRNPDDLADTILRDWTKWS